MIEFDVIVGGEVKETLRPNTSRLKEVYDYINEQMKLMRGKYGYEVKVMRRILY
ncbi:mechanosensitive ion channel protein MscL [Cohnella rhizosphaerae]|uniref:Mechanosensitive ion channel protein MscL n=1 Tax=Cohnella rhizosphaerae TaxID=1457232 RepID=A0A9X4QRX3_9BACL|nr:mechanosensitive ion channel protein MscL [Cohnella rhizosphaerae]MDG0808694.1 mechanosensitive ion channel protein MscL [Cohnella rhizosphaerae]